MDPLGDDYDNMNMNVSHLDIWHLHEKQNACRTIFMAQKPPPFPPPMKVFVLGRFDIFISGLFDVLLWLGCGFKQAFGYLGVDGFQEVLQGFHEAFHSFSTVDGRNPAPPRMYKTL